MVSKRDDYNGYMRNYMQEYRKKRRLAAQEALGGSCVRCGATEDLHFDHVDPADKEITISTAIATRSAKVVATELQKCQLLCTTCHKQKTRENKEYGSRAVEKEHGTAVMYATKCRCEACRSWKRDYRSGRVDARGLPRQHTGS